MEDLQQIIPEGFKASFTSRKTYIIFGSVIVGLCLMCVVLAGLLAHSMSSKVTSSSTSGSSAGGSAAALVMGGTRLTPQVMETAAWLGENIDPSVDRCDNFYKFACGGWEDNNFVNPTRFSTSMYSHLRAENEEKLREIIDSPISRNTPSSAERKMKEFFKMCLHDYGRMKEGGKKLVDIIRNDLNGWYVFDPTGWANGWDKQRTIARLQGEYLVSVFFEVYMTFDPADFKKNIIAIRQGGTGMRYYYYVNTFVDRGQVQESYKDYMRRVASLILRDANITLTDTERETRVEQFVSDAYGHEERMAQAMYDGRRQADWWRSVKTTLGELHNNFTQIDWMSVFEKLYSEVGVSGFQEPLTINRNTEVAIRPSSYFTYLERILANETQDRDRILNNYMIWRLIDEYVPHLSWEYQHARYTFMESRTGRKEFKSTWHACVDTARDKLGTALAAEFLRLHVTAPSKKKAELMVGKIQDAYVAQIDSNTWMDSATKELAKQKVKAVSSLVAFPRTWFNETLVDRIHQTLVVNKSLGYFNAILSLNHLTRVMRLKELAVGHHYYLWTFALNSGGFGVHPFYFFVYNTVVVPSGALQFPMYMKGGLDFFNFGALGTALGVELANSVNDMGRFDWINGTFMDWWSQNTSDSYLKVEMCFENHFTGIKAGPYLVQGENKTVTLDGSYQAWRGVDELSGMRAAYLAYTSWLKEGNASKEERQFVYSPEQAFFISAAQTHCYKTKDVNAYHWAKANHIPQDVMLNGVLSNMPEFAEAFKCPDDSKMKAKKACPSI